MLQLSKSLINVPVMSLRVGGQVATAVQPIINPKNLKIEGWFCDDNRSREQLILLSSDVRELLPQGLVIDDYEVLAHPEDLIRMKSLIELHFGLIGHQVVSDKKRKLGKVSDFAAETTTFYIEKFYTTQSLLRNLKGGNTSVDRRQIIEINERQIVVKDPAQPLRAEQSQGARQPQPQPLPASPIQ